MADTVTATTVFNGSKRLVRHLTSESDGTGESNVIKVNKSDFTGPDGTEPSTLVIDRIEYDVTAMRVTLSWDNTTDVTIAVLQGQGCLDFSSVGGLVNSGDNTPGDVLLTTALHAAGDGYDITLYMRKKD